MLSGCELQVISVPHRGALLRAPLLLTSCLCAAAYDDQDQGILDDAMTHAPSIADPGNDLSQHALALLHQLQGIVTDGCSTLC